MWKICLVVKLLTVAFQRKRENNSKFMVSVTWLNELCSSQIKVGEKLNPAPHCNYLIGKVGNSQMKVNAVVAQNNF